MTVQVLRGILNLTQFLAMRMGDPVPGSMTCHLPWLIKNTTRQQKIPLRGKWMIRGATGEEEGARCLSSSLGGSICSSDGMKYSSFVRGQRSEGG